MTNPDRAAQLEQVADEFTRRRYGPNPDLNGDLIEAVAEFALSLAEATQEEIGKWHDEQEEQKMEEAAAYRAAGMPEVAREAFGRAAHHHACAKRIRATPIPIPLTSTQETDHD